MSIKAVNWALNNVRCTPDLKVILIAMGERADDHGVCYPSQTELSEKACIPLRSLKRKMATLKDAQVMKVITKQVKTNLRRNTYILRLDQSFDLLKKKEAKPVESTQKNSASLAPSFNEHEDWDGANLAPLNSASLAPKSEQWCQSSGTQDGATQVAHEPPINHHDSNNNINTTDEVSSLFEIPSTRTQVQMSPLWKPSDHVFDQLKTTKGIDKEFCLSVLPEFTIYHNGSNARQGAFDSKFLKHVIHNWETTKTKTSTAPRVIPSDWKPNFSTERILKASGIDQQFIWDQIDRFVLYWSERGEPRHSWNSLFLDSCKRSWEQRTQSTGLSVSGDSLLVRAGDRSWAE